MLETSNCINDWLIFWRKKLDGESFLSLQDSISQSLNHQSLLRLSLGTIKPFIDCEYHTVAQLKVLFIFIFIINTYSIKN